MYPITFIPIIRPYIGGGLTVFANSFVLNNSFVGGLIGDPSISEAIAEVATLKAAGTISPEAQQALEQKLSGLGETVKQRVQDQAMEEGVKTSIGGHVLIGMRAKLPVIPIAAYSNVKFYFGGDYPDEVDPGIVALELGIGLAL